MAYNFLYINTTTRQLVAGLDSTTVVDVGSLNFNVGDDFLPLGIFLLQQPLGYNPNDAFASGLQNIGTAGIALNVCLSNGLAGGAAVKYTEQIIWPADPTGTYFYGTLSMNSAGLLALIGAATTAQAWLQIEYFDMTIGGRRTVFSAQVTLDVGYPNTDVSVPAGQVALTVQQAQAMFVPLVPVPGQPIPFASPAGKKFEIVATDNPDGSAEYDVEQVN